MRILHFFDVKTSCSIRMSDHSMFVSPPVCHKLHNHAVYCATTQFSLSQIAQPRSLLRNHAVYCATTQFSLSQIAQPRSLLCFKLLHGRRAAHAAKRRALFASRHVSGDYVWIYYSN